MDSLERLILIKSMFSDQLRDRTSVETSRHVVAGRNRTEGPGVVDES
jgi:hypothetical protein